MSNEEILFTVGKESGEAMAAVVDALADKRIKLSEGITIAKEFGTLAVVVFKHHAGIGRRFTDGFSIEEQEQLRQGFAEGFDLKNKLTEEVVQDYFNMALDVLGDIARVVMKATKAA